MNSSALEFENSKNPFSLRREWMERCLSLATEYRQVNGTIRRRAQEFEKAGVAVMDALHVAIAESANADFFIACDDRLLKKGKHFKIKSINPVDFVRKELGEQP